ncbi:hypothetical protein GmHk_20G058147 [Glycine max]|nr:hypothetical protein GmHk_20G058147 [Glycine max]
MKDMPRTRSGDRTRPTPSVCRRERRAVEAPEHVAAHDVVPKDVVFGGGPKDKSILIEYIDHVACKLWDGLLVAHGRKLRDLPPPPPPIRRSCEWCRIQGYFH